MKGSIERALKHFDRFYPNVYSSQLWPSIRLGLLCKSKKMFLMNNAYSDANKLINQLKMNGAINFLDNLIVKENLLINNKEIHDDILNNEISVGTQLNEFVKTTKYIGERSVFSRTIDKVFTNYSSNYDEEEILKYLKEDLREIKSNMIDYEELNIPLNLNVMAYPRGIIKKDFPVPHDELNHAGFYPIDGFSILVVLLMNIQKQDRILDLCAAPGGKSVAMLLTGLPCELVCIDSFKSRISRLKKVIRTHTSPEDEAKVSIVHGNGIDETHYMNNYFDKVLVDVPCSSDRHAVTDAEFSLFSPQKDREREKLLQTQHSLLRMAIRSCKVGGDILYSTCTLSPLQNDNVVISIIKEMNDQGHDYELRVVNTRSTYVRTACKNADSDVTAVSDWFVTFNDGHSLGEIILPSIVNNYGPGYVCKIRKVAVGSV